MTKIMIDEATVKLALEALEKCEVAWPGTRFKSKYFDEEKTKQAITALREALTSVPDWASEAKKQPRAFGTLAQQEPVATDWERIARVQNAKLMAVCDEPEGFEKLCEVMDRYERTPPPAQRTWVGLTEDDATQIQRNMVYQNQPFTKVIKVIEAKLKEKNT